jgi:preprotein translocase subunit SecD
MLHFQRWKLIMVAVVVIAGFLYALPNVFPKSSLQGVPAWLPHKQVNLGLDLQGGAHLLYQLDERKWWRTGSTPFAAMCARRCAGPASAIPT